MSGWPAAVAAGWHPVAALSELGRRPLGRRLMGQPLVAFRAGGAPAVLRDRCPHRGAPLSRGRLVEGAIECPYHGWRFGPDGACRHVTGAATVPLAAAARLPVVVHAGLVWTSLAADPPPFPSLPPAMEDPTLDRFWWLLRPTRAGLLDALENHLDPAHPHHVHPWMVRSPTRRARVDVEVRSGPWGAEAVYHEGTRNTALLPAAMEGTRARSVGRLWPPLVGEVRLEAADGRSLSIAVAFAPEAEGLVRPWAHFASPRGRLPAWFKRLGLKAFHLPVLLQDRRMLRLQDEGRTGEPYATGPLDVLSGAIWRLANGLDEPERARRLEMWL